jgi:hypothetical protein
MKNVEVEAEKIYKREIIKKIVKLILLFLLEFISIVYLVLYVVYQSGRFTVTLDKNLSNRKNVFLSENGNVKERTRHLAAGTIEYMDNISIKWLPANLDIEQNGSHNGDNYIAYTFYVVNGGKETVHYWFEIDVDDTIRRVDEAIRIMIYKNGEPTVYAKKNEATGEAEPDTKKFVSESIAVLEQRKEFKPQEKDRYTVVVWIEGDDPECNNDLLGGEVKMHIDITEEHVDIKEKNSKEKKYGKE